MLDLNMSICTKNMLYHNEGEIHFDIRTFALRFFHSGMMIPVSGTFQCEDGDGQIPLYWVCDFMTDCNDGSDEKDCEEGRTVIKMCLSYV